MHYINRKIAKFSFDLLNVAWNESSENRSFTSFQFQNPAKSEGLFICTMGKQFQWFHMVFEADM